MNLKLSWCRRRVTCSAEFCQKEISVGNPIIKGTYKTKNGLTIRRYWHPGCWLEAGLAYLHTHPYQKVPGKGRPTLELSQYDKRARRLLTCRRARAMQRIRWLIPRLPDSEGMIDRLYEQIEGIKQEIAKVGGIPKSWE